MSFQENLRYYREKAGYKQAKDFAEALNIPYSTYTGYEVRNREPKYETLCKIADLLQVSTDDLLGRTTNILGNKDDEKLLSLLNKSNIYDDYFKSIIIDDTFIKFKVKLMGITIQLKIRKDKYIYFINTFNEIKEKMLLIFLSEIISKQNINISLEYIDKLVHHYLNEYTKIKNPKRKDTYILYSLLSKKDELSKIKEIIYDNFNTGYQYKQRQALENTIKSLMQENINLDHKFYETNIIDVNTEDFLSKMYEDELLGIDFSIDKNIKNK